MSDKNRPFIWETVYEDRTARREGMFQGRLVARTFLEHLLDIDGIDEADRVPKRPVGALILAVQAVHRALIYWLTGRLEVPPDKKSAEFSKTNWGDYILIDPRGNRKVKRASVYLRTINNLREQQWADILKVSLSFQPSGKQKTRIIKDEEPISETESEDDLVDPRYDVVPSAVE